MFRSHESPVFGPVLACHRFVEGPVVAVAVDDSGRIRPWRGDAGMLLSLCTRRVCFASLAFSFIRFDPSHTSTLAKTLTLILSLSR